MTYYPFSEGSLAQSEQMMRNYYHIADGVQYPFSVSANNGFTLASATYDIGASTTVFQDVHTVNLHLYDSVASADKSLWYLVAESTLSDTATAITFSLTSGIDGDSCEVYRIFCKFAAITGTMRMIINGDSAANYGWQYMRGISSASDAARATGQNYIEVGSCLAVTTGVVKISYSEVLLYAKTGNERLALIDYGTHMTGDFVYSIINRSGIWNNSANTITTLKFIHNADSFYTGTNIQIWGRQ